MKELNELVKGIMGRPMTGKQCALLKVLQGRVKKKELTVEQAREIWAKEVEKP